MPHDTKHTRARQEVGADYVVLDISYRMLPYIRISKVPHENRIQCILPPIPVGIPLFFVVDTKGKLQCIKYRSRIDYDSFCAHRHRIEVDSRYRIELDIVSRSIIGIVSKSTIDLGSRLSVSCSTILLVQIDRYRSASSSHKKDTGTR